MLPMVQAEPVLFNSAGHSADGASPTATLPPSLTPDSEVEGLAEFFYDIDVAVVNTFSRIESCDLQPGDTWRGMQGKMSVTAPGKKIRKKSSDIKPQSQQNKCHNEKRRRELENEVINQLEELLGTCLAEVKQPDKNGIVREATRQIEDVLQRRRDCPGDCPLRVLQCLSPVQAGEVSSTQHQPSSGFQYSELSTLIEAIKHYTGVLGLILMEINSKGEIECVTENIKDLILAERTELYKKSIFSLLHADDHAKIKPLLRNIQNFAWGSTESDKFQYIHARLLIKDANVTDGDSFVDTVIHAAPVRGSSTEEAGSVMCVIRRCESAAISNDAVPTIVFRLDCNFNILSCDLSGVENCMNSPVSLLGTRYLDLVESSDRARVSAHLQEVVARAGLLVVSEPYRLRITSETPRIRVSAQARLFPTVGEPDFIMSTNTVLTDDDIGILEPGGSRPALGGPLMTSVANGETSSSDSRYRCAISPADPQFSMNDFDLESWPQSFSMGDMSGEDSKERKENNEELNPHTSPVDAQGVSHEKPNRLRSLLIKKSGPSTDANSNNQILKDLLKQEDEEATSSETSAPHTPHTPHTPQTPHTPHTPLTPASARSPLHSAQAHARPPPHHATHQPVMHNNQLLKILNDKSDEDGDESRRNSTDSSRGPSQTSVLSQLLSNSNGPSSNGRSQEGSDMYMDRIAGMKRKFEESKASSSNIKRVTPENQQKTSQVSSSATNAGNVTVVTSAASGSTSPATSSAGMSALCQKNQILVSLLARQQTTPPTPLPLPNTILRSYPPRARPPPLQPPHTQMQRPHHMQQQQRLIHPTISTVLNTSNRGSSMNGAGPVSSAPSAECPSSMSLQTSQSMPVQSHLQMVLQGVSRNSYQAGVAAQPHYAAPSAHHPYNNQGSRSQSGSGDSEVPSDQALSDILDEVIENMPYNDRPAPDVAIMDMDSNRQIRSDYQGVKEKNAVINAITQSLMQCETATKSPVSSSPVPPVYPVQSPGSVSGQCTMSGGVGVGNVYGLVSRDADGARARALVEQQRARLLQMQRSQSLLVSPEAAEQPQPDLGSTINALVSATPPNVALTRNDYHHLYHQPNQMGTNYGTNKLTSSQQNPMLSRQLGVGGNSYAAALHTPQAPQPYHRAPRPHPVLQLFSLIQGFLWAATMRRARRGPTAGSTGGAWRTARTLRTRTLTRTRTHTAITPRTRRTLRTRRTRRTPTTRCHVSSTSDRPETDVYIQRHSTFFICH
nr:uncharacterized protein LOC116779506 isoform X8 [Danaus plexippus plexippus]